MSLSALDDLLLAIMMIAFMWIVKSDLVTGSPGGVSLGLWLCRLGAQIASTA